MVTLFIILMITACVGLGFIVLIQNPKGGGLNANVGGLSNNFMGVKQTTDVLEKGTWIFVSVIAILAVTSTLFLTKAGSGGSKGIIDKLNTTPISSPTAPAAPVQQNATPAQTPAAPAATTPTGKK
jgi:preprotein translocase subunit SecG